MKMKFYVWYDKSMFLCAYAKNIKEARKEIVDRGELDGGNWLDYMEWQSDKKHYDGYVSEGWYMLESKPAKYKTSVGFVFEFL